MMNIWKDVYYIFFFKQKTAYEMRISDWSSDVCSSDLESPGLASAQAPLQEPRINIGRFAAMDLEEDAPQSAPLHEDAGSQEQPHHRKWYNSWPFQIGRAHV